MIYVTVCASMFSRAFSARRARLGSPTMMSPFSGKIDDGIRISSGKSALDR